MSRKIIVTASACIVACVVALFLGLSQQSKDAVKEAAVPVLDIVLPGTPEAADAGSATVSDEASSAIEDVGAIDLGEGPVLDMPPADE